MSRIVYGQIQNVDAVPYNQGTIIFSPIIDTIQRLTSVVPVELTVEGLFTVILQEGTYKVSVSYTRGTDIIGDIGIISAKEPINLHDLLNQLDGGTSGLPIDITYVFGRKLNDLKAPTGSVDFAGQLGINIALPINASDIASKGYVDSITPKNILYTCDIIDEATKTFNQFLSTYSAIKTRTVVLFRYASTIFVEYNLIAGDTMLVEIYPSAPSSLLTYSSKENLSDNRVILNLQDSNLYLVAFDGSINILGGI